MLEGRLRRFCGLATLVVALASCSSAPEPGTPPPATPEPGAAAPTDAAEPAESETRPAAAAAPRAPDPTGTQTVTIEPAEPEGEAPTLIEAARRERARRQTAGEPIAVITDANLGEHATGVLTFVEEEPEETGAGPDATAADEGGAEAADERGEAYWRERVGSLRRRWADAAGRVPALEEDAAELRRRFYETDDGFYRDSRIKPAWDRAIDQIAQARAEAESYRLELEQALDEGRRAGALPGWLREGVELEPAAPEPESDIHEPGEPVIVGEDDG